MISFKLEAKRYKFLAAFLLAFATVYAGARFYMNILERRHTLVSFEIEINGVVESYFANTGYTFVSMDDGRRYLVPPANRTLNDIFSQHLSNGDTVLKEPMSSVIIVRSRNASREYTIPDVGHGHLQAPD